MKRTLVLVAVAAVVLAGCTTSDLTGSSGDATLELMVSDQPNDISSFDSLDVTFSKARIFNASDSFEEMSLGATVDLTQVVGDNATLVGSMDLDSGEYTKVEMHVDSVAGVVDGSETTVNVPSDKLMITKTFTVEANTTTQFVFDIEVVKQGTQDSYNLLPVISKSGVAGEDVEVEEVPPAQAR